MSSRGDARADAEVGAIIGPAWSWRWQAPELALVFGERAQRIADQRGDQLAALWAQTLVVSASCRLGQQLAVVDKAIEALRLSERLAADDAGAILRVELAGCARSAGVPLVGAGLLRPVLSVVDARPAVRAAALIQLAGCLAYSERHRELDDALAEADQLYADDRELDQDAGLGRRAVLRSFVAREHRRRGDLRAALHAAEEGADLLGGLSDPTADGGAAARISLQQVLGLLDLGWVDQAATVAAGALSGPVRAHSSAAVGWLALAISTRVQMPAGLIGPAIALLQEITTMAERHHRDALHAEGLSALSEAHEQAGELAETLDYLRSAQVIRARRSRALRAARSALLGAFGEARNADDLLRLLNPTLSTGRRRSVEREQPSAGQRGGSAQPEASGITMVLIDVSKNRSGLPPAAHGPVAAGALGSDPAGIGTWTAESLGAGSRAGDPIGESVLRKVVEHLRDLTPAEAALARIGGAELAVLLPGTSRSQVERWAEELRAAMADVDWGQVTPGLIVNVRTVVTEGEANEDTPDPERRPGRATAPPASGIALEAQPTRSRRSGELTSPRLSIPPQPGEPERSSALIMGQPVPPARTPTEPPEQSGGRRSRGALPVEPSSPEPVRTPLPQASWHSLLAEPPQDPAETARRRHAASQEPTQRWKPTWMPADEQSSGGRWVLDPSEAKPTEPAATEPPSVERQSATATPAPPASVAPAPAAAAPASETAKRAADAPSGLDRFGLGSLVGTGTGTGRRRSEDAESTPPASTSHRSPELAEQSTPDSGRRRADETPSAEPGSRHSAPADQTRSVLGSLGISAGSGGRRRAPETTDAPREPRRRAREDAELPAASTPQPPSSGADSEPTGRRARRDYSQPLSGLIPAVEPSSGGRRRAEDTIPKIRLPQLPSPAQPDPRTSMPTGPTTSGFPGAAFPGSGFAGFTPQTGPPPAAPTPFAGPTPPGFLPTTGPTAKPAPTAGLAAPPGPVPPPGLIPPAAFMPPAAATPGSAFSPGGLAAPGGPASSTGYPPSADLVSADDLTPPSGFALPTAGLVPPAALPAVPQPIPPQPALAQRNPSRHIPAPLSSPEPTPAQPRSHETPPASGQRPAEDAASHQTASGYLDLGRISAEFRRGFSLGQATAEPTPEASKTSAERALVERALVERALVEPAVVEPALVEPAAVEPVVVEPVVVEAPSVGLPPVELPSVELAAVELPRGELAGGGSGSVEPASDESGADGGSSFSALSEFSAMLARFDDNPAPSAIELPEPSTTPLRPASAEAAALPEPELTPPSRAERSATAQPFAPETMFGGRGRTEQPAGADPEPTEAQSTEARPAAETRAAETRVVGTQAVGAPAVGAPADKPVEQAPRRAAEEAVELPAASVERVDKAPEPLRPSPPPTGIAAKLAGPEDSEFESDVASIEGRSGRGRRRTPKLGDLLTEALRAYQDVRDSDEASGALGSGSEPSELGATELGSWLGTGTEPLGSIDPPSWRPGSSTRSFGVARHGGGDESGDSRRQPGSDWHPPTG